MPFVLGLLSSVVYGTADFLGGFASRRANVVAVTALSQAAGFVALLVAMPFVPGAPRPADLAWGALAGVAGAIGVVLLYRALAAGTVSTFAPMISLIAIAVPVAFGVLGGERPGLAPALGIVAGVLAVLLVGQNETPAGPGAPRPPRGSTRHLVPIAIASGLFIGLFLVGLGRIGHGSGLAPLVLARGIGTLVLAMGVAVRRVDLRPVAAQWRVVLGCGACDVAGNLLYMLAAQRAPLSLTATLVSLAPASTVVLAQAVLHERLGRAQKFGVALALLAVALLAQGAAH